MSDTNPMFSFIIPTFNRPIPLKICLQSILDQDVQDYEIIIINDGSSKDLDWVPDFDSRIRYYNQNHAGRSDARNNGLEKANGKYIIFMDDDDHFLPHFLSTAKAFYDSTENDNTILKLGALWQKIVQKRKVQTEEPMIFDGDFSAQSVFRNIFFKSLSCGQTIIPKEHLFNVRFDTSLNYSEDLKFFLTLASKKIPFYELEKPSVVFFDHRNRSIYKKEKLKEQEESRAALRAFAELVNKDLNYLMPKDLAFRASKDNAILAKQAGKSAPLCFIKYALLYWINKVKYLLS